MVHVKQVGCSNVCLFKLYIIIIFFTAGIVKYMRAQVGPASRDLSTLASYEAFMKAPEAAIVGFFEKESDLKGVFTKYADQQREKFRFGHTSNPDVLAKVGEK